MLFSLLALATVLAGSDPDEIVSTAPRTAVNLDVGEGPVAPSVGSAAQDAAPHGLTTDQQIDRWLESRDPAATPFAGAAPADDGEPHGEFSVTVGTQGYRDYGAAVSFPLGENGRLNLSFRQVENGFYGYGLQDPRLDDRFYPLPGRTSGSALEWRREREEDVWGHGRPATAERSR